MPSRQINIKLIEENWDDGKYTDDDRARLYKGKPHEGHKQNFYRCIRDGGLTVSDVFSHVQAMNTCHLAAIAARLNRKITWDPKNEKILDDEQASNTVKLVEERVEDLSPKTGSFSCECRIWRVSADSGPRPS